MKIISKYLLREHIFPFFMALGGILFLFILNIIMKMMAKFVGKGIELPVVIEFFYLSLGFILAMAIPMSVLVASLMAYGRITQDNEYAVLQSSGVSVYQLMAPMIIVGILMSWFMIYFNNSILPEMNHKNKILRQSISRKKPIAIIEPGIFITDIPGYIIKAERVNHIKNLLYDVIVLESDKNSRTKRTITADSGKIFYASATDRYNIILNSGEISNLDLDKPDSYFRSHFEKMVLTQEQKGIDFEVKDNDFYNDRELPADSLRAKIARLEKVGASKKSIYSVKVELYKKYAISLSCLIFVLVGAPLGLMSGKSGMGGSIAFSVIIFTIYWLFLMVGEKLADRGLLNPWFAMWNANIVIGILSIFLIYQATKGTKIGFEFMKDFWHWIVKIIKRFKREKNV